ncbi:MAG: hypothetical protein JXR76_32710 [Deltaproteobacteria bacterium]|nr:hypothetical protein [Deltaproteobacteria bacterium]
MNREEPLQTDDIALLLRHRKLKREHIHDEILLKLAVVMAEEADDDTKLEVDRHLASCAECREALVMYQGTSEIGGTGEIDANERSNDVIENAARNRMPDKPIRMFAGRMRTMGAIAAILLFAGVLPVWMMIRDRTPEDTASALAVKGRADDISVVIRRNGRAFIARPSEPLQTGDDLGFFYSAKKKGYLALFTRDSSKSVYLLHPVDGVRSASIDAGLNVSLPDGASVETVSRCEWVIGVFSDSPLSVADLERNVADAMETNSSCGLALQIPNARSVAVFPFTGDKSH